MKGPCRQEVRTEVRPRKREPGIVHSHPSESISLVWPQNYGCPQRLSYNIEQIFEYSNFWLIDKYLEIPFVILDGSDNRCMWLRPLLTQSGHSPTILSLFIQKNLLVNIC